MRQSHDAGRRPPLGARLCDRLLFGAAAHDAAGASAMGGMRRLSDIRDSLRQPPAQPPRAAPTAAFSEADVGGFVAPGWEAVRTAFAENFSNRGDVSEAGASCAVTFKGEPVVDIWGGVANPKSGTPWEQDTLVNVFSSTKGVVALAVNQLIDRGFIDIAEPVSKIWPEFTGGGKELLTVEQLLSHQAGLMNGATLGHMLAGFDTATAALAAAEPAWHPTANLFAYHGEQPHPAPSTLRPSRSRCRTTPPT